MNNTKRANVIIFSLLMTSFLAYCYFRPGILPLLIFGFWDLLGNPLNESIFIRMSYTIIYLTGFIIFYKLFDYYYSNNAAKIIISLLSIIVGAIGLILSGY